MLLDADYSAMELRLLADLGKDPTFLEIFEKDLDPHSVVGTMITGKEIRKKGALGPGDPGINSELRDPVKSLNFMICYGGGPKKLSDKTGLDYKTCRRFIDEYWKRFPSNRKFFDDFVTESIEAKCVRSKYDGRLRWLDGFDFDNPAHVSHVRNLCMNFNMQSGNASITKLALVKLRTAVKDTPCKIVATIHDKFLLCLNHFNCWKPSLGF